MILKGSGFNSQYTHGLSQPWISPVSEDPVSSSDFCSYRENVHTHIKKKKKSKRGKKSLKKPFELILFLYIYLLVQNYGTHTFQSRFQIFLHPPRTTLMYWTQC